MYYLQDSYPEEALRQQLERARQSEFYRQLDPLAASDYSRFSSLKPTTKEDLRQGYPFQFLAVGPKQLATYHESSGTTGTPTATYFTETDWLGICARFLRNDVGISADDMVLVKTPYALTTTAHQMHQAARLRGATVIPADNRSHNMPYGKLIRLLHTLPVTVTWSLPTEVLIWAEAAKACGLDPKTDFPHLRAFLVAGEPLSPQKKRLLSETWGGKAVYEDYGSTETGSLAGECSRGHLHLWSDEVFCEVDGKLNQGKVVGQLLVTPLGREAMPLIRYRSGDIVEVDLEECGCRNPLPRIRVLGRTGQEYPTRAIESIIHDPEATFCVPFWRARQDQGRVEQLEIYVASGCPQEAADEISHLLHCKLGGHVEVTAVPRSTFIADHSLKDPGSFQKPKFIFQKSENWHLAAQYA